MILNSIKPRILYFGRTKGIHDQKFVAELQNHYQLDETYLDEEKIRTKAEYDFYDAIVAGPLTDVISAISRDSVTPLIGISHGFDLNLEKDDQLLEKNINQCTSIIVDCKLGENILKSTYNYKKNIYRMPFGCDYELFSKNNINFQNIPNILVTRNWYQNYRNDLIVDAIFSLLKSGIEIQITFIGDGPLLDQVLKNHDLEAMKSNFKFLGRMPLNSIKAEMTKNWIYVSASETDGTSVSMLEALSAGMICIVSDFPSNKEWINHGVNGFLFKNQNCEDLIEKILTVASLSISQKMRIGLEAQSTVQINGNWKFNRTVLKKAIEESISRKKQ